MLYLLYLKFFDERCVLHSSPEISLYMRPHPVTTPKIMGMSGGGGLSFCKEYVKYIKRLINISKSETHPVVLVKS